MIISYSFNQQEIINNILKLYNHNQPIHLDPCYNVGGFYKNGVVAEPLLKGDLNPVNDSILKLDVLDLPFPTGSIKSAIFDPPFIVNADKSYKMAQRYSSFNSVEELKEFFRKGLSSLQRVLKHGGLLIVKCQDFIYGRKQHCIYPFIYDTARELNFAYRDTLILLAKSRIVAFKTQNHARKFHSYFIVFKCNKRK